jgi:outer membrane protein assembly factor BamB
VYTVASDGMLHVLGMQTGKDLQKPAAFLPANARATDLIAVNRTLYAATSGECGGVPNGVWALDLASEAKPVTSWKTNGGGVAGLAFATDGTLLATVGPGKAAAGGYANAIVALDPTTLQLKDWFMDPKIELASMPLVFKSNGKEIVAAAARDGRILLLDLTSLGGSSHSTPLHISRPFATGSGFAPEALATWQEAITTAGTAATAPGTTGAAQAPPPQGAPPAGVPQGPLTTLPGAPGTPGGPAAGSAGPTSPAGTRWLLVPVAGPLPADAQAPGANGVKSGAVLALKVVDQGGKLSLEPGWISRDLPSPATPLVVNGVVFALSGGKPRDTSAAPPSDLAKRGTPAVLYALDGRDGKELWSSGKRMTSFLSARSFWSATGQVYVGTYDGTLYAFGPAMDRR